MIFYCYECDERKDSDEDVAEFTTDNQPVCTDCFYKDLEQPKEISNDLSIHV